MRQIGRVFVSCLLVSFRLDLEGVSELNQTRHSLMLHWFADLMNVTEGVTIHRPNVSTLLFTKEKIKTIFNEITS